MCGGGGGGGGCGVWVGGGCVRCRVVSGVVREWGGGSEVPPAEGGGGGEGGGVERMLRKSRCANRRSNGPIWPIAQEGLRRRHGGSRGPDRRWRSGGADRIDPVVAGAVFVPCWSSVIPAPRSIPRHARSTRERWSSIASAASKTPSRAAGIPHPPHRNDHLGANASPARRLNAASPGAPPRRAGRSARYAIACARRITSNRCCGPLPSNRARAHSAFPPKPRVRAAEGWRRCDDRGSQQRRATGGRGPAYVIAADGASEPRSPAARA